MHTPDLFDGRTFGCFADSSLPSYDRDATVLLIQRVLGFLRAR